MVGLRLTLPALLAALCLSGVSSAKPKAKKAESAKLDDKKTDKKSSAEASKKAEDKKADAKQPDPPKKDDKPDVGPGAGAGTRKVDADKGNDKPKTEPPKEPPKPKVEEEKKDNPVSHRRGPRPRKPSPTLPKGAERSSPKESVRRAIAGGKTLDDLRAGTDDPELRALKEADRVLFPRPLHGATPGFDWNLPAPARRGSPDVVASGLPPEARVSPSTGTEDDAVTAEWLRSLTMPNLPVRLEARVVRYLKFYRDNSRGRAIAKVWARKSGRFVPAIKAELAKAGLPSDLVWLSLIESGHNPTIYSPVGAAGLWQFMPASGRMYGLTVDRWVDERLDPKRSTDAAILYLSDLYRRFGNWELAMGAYNMGHGGMTRAIQKFNTNDFWELCRHEAGIPWETTLYVPKIFAIAIVMNNKKAFGIADVKPDPPESFDSVLVGSGTSLEQVAAAAETSVSTIESLNPQLLASRAPPRGPGRRELKWHVRVPKGRGVSTTSRMAKVWAADSGLASYVVKLGDTPEAIAKSLRFPEVQLRALNHIDKDEVLDAWTVLLVPRSASQRKPAEPETPDVVVVPPRRFDYPDRQRIFYVVRPGDSLTEIASAVGVTAADLESWNAIDPNARLQPGMTLQAWVADAARLASVRYFQDADTRVLVAGTPEFIEYYEGLNGKERIVVAARDGDTLSKIGRRYGVSSGWMERINRKSRRKKLKAGDSVVVYVKKGTRGSSEIDETTPEPLPAPEAPAPEALPAVPSAESAARPSTAATSGG